MQEQHPHHRNARPDSGPGPAHFPLASASLGKQDTPKRYCDSEGYALVARALANLPGPTALIDGLIGIEESLKGANVFARGTIDATLNALADCVGSRVRSRQPWVLIAHLTDYFSSPGGFGFRFPPESRDRAAEESIHLVSHALRDKDCAKPMLSALFIEIGRRIGLPDLYPLHIPQETLIAVGGDGKRFVLDVKDGRKVDRDEVFARAKAAYEGNQPITDLLIKPVKLHYLLEQVLHGLLRVYEDATSLPAMTKVLELKLLAFPGNPELERDLGVVLANLQDRPSAVHYLRSFLSKMPDHADAKSLATLVDNLEST